MRPQSADAERRLPGPALLLVAVALALLAAAWSSLQPEASSLQQRLAAGLPLRVGYALEPPYAFLDAEGRLRGESVEVLDAVLADLGIEARSHVRLDFGSLLAELQAGRIDVVAGGMFITPERSQRVRFTRPTAAVGSGLLARPGYTGGGRLAVLQGSVEAAAAERLGYPPQRVLELPDAQTALAALAAGKVDAFALSLPSLRWLAGHDPRLQGFAVLPRPELPEGRPAFALRRSEHWLAERLDAALADLIGSARHRALVEAHGFTALELEAVADRPLEAGDAR